MNEQPVSMRIEWFNCHEWVLSFWLSLNEENVRIIQFNTGSDIITRLRRWLENCSTTTCPVNLLLSPWKSSEQFIYYPISHNLWIFEYYREDEVKKNKKIWFEPHSHRAFVNLKTMINEFYTSFKSYFSNVSDFYIYSRVQRERKTLLWKLQASENIDYLPEHIPFRYLKQIYSNVIFNLQGQFANHNLYNHDEREQPDRFFWNLEQVLEKNHVKEEDYDLLTDKKKLKILQEIVFIYPNFKWDDNIDKFLSFKLEKFLETFNETPTDREYYPTEFFFSPINVKWWYLECYIGETYWDYRHITIPEISESVYTLLDWLKKLRSEWDSDLLNIWNSKIGFGLYQDSNEFWRSRFLFTQSLWGKLDIFEIKANITQIKMSIIWALSTFVTLPHFDEKQRKGFSKTENNRDWWDTNPDDFWIFWWVDELFIYQHLNKVKNDRYQPHHNRLPIEIHLYQRKK